MAKVCKKIKCEDIISPIRDKELLHKYFRYRKPQLMKSHFVLLIVVLLVTIDDMLVFISANKEFKTMELD